MFAIPYQHSCDDSITLYSKQADEKIAAKEAGLDIRPITQTEIQKHLDDFGLAKEFGTYGKIRGLSGGQKVKLVLAAAMWWVCNVWIN